MSSVAVGRVTEALGAFGPKPGLLQVTFVDVHVTTVSDYHTSVGGLRIPVELHARLGTRDPLRVLLVVGQLAQLPSPTVMTFNAALHRNKSDHQKNEE